MSIVYRSVKGSKLTSAEVDGNFQHLENLVGGAGNSIVTETGFTLVDQDVTFAANWVWNILNTQYTNPAAVVINIPFAASGNQRIDLIVANQSNTFERITGVESVSNPTAPAVPLNKISVTFITVTDGVVGTPTDPIIGTSFVKKSFFAPFISTVTGADAIIPLDPNGYTEIRLTDASLTSIAGFDLSLITGVPTAEVPYNGKPYIIRNVTGNSITIKNELGAADYPFFLSGGGDLVFPNGQAIYVLYDSSGFNEIFKSWSTLDEATDFGNTTTNDIITGKITTPMVRMPKGSFNVHIYPVDLTANRKLEAPDKNGIIATIADVNLKLDKDFSTLPNATLPLDFTETIAVRQTGTTKQVEISKLNKSFVFTIELIDYLTVDFYAPDELKINTIQQIVNLPSIDILVNDTSYTLGNVIGRGDKITIVSDIVGVVNLKGNYE